jgi:hypothetical protein
VKKTWCWVVLLAAMLLMGCAGSVQKPYIYSPEENRGGFGVPAAQVGATGRASYCSQGLPQLVQDRKKQAYAGIAQVCGGENKYSIIDELSGPARTTALGIEASCAGFAGRVIYFKCTGAAPRPTGLTK